MFKLNNQHYYNAKDIAANLSITETAVNKLIRRYKDQLDDYIIKHKTETDYRPVRYISEKGIAILLNVKDKQNVSRTTDNLRLHQKTSQETKYKEHVAKEAIAKNEPSNQLGFTGSLTDMAKVLMVACERVEQNTQEIKELQGDMARLKGDTENFPIRKGQKKILNERVRGIAIHAKAPYSKVWSKLHQLVGKRTIDDYVFEDYTLALSIVDDWIKKFKLDF